MKIIKKMIYDWIKTALSKGTEKPGRGHRNPCKDELGRFTWPHCAPEKRDKESVEHKKAQEKYRKRQEHKEAKDKRKESSPFASDIPLEPEKEALRQRQIQSIDTKLKKYHGSLERIDKYLKPNITFGISVDGNTFRTVATKKYDFTNDDGRFHAKFYTVEGRKYSDKEEALENTKQYINDYLEGTQKPEWRLMVRDIEFSKEKNLHINFHSLYAGHGKIAYTAVYDELHKKWIAIKKTFVMGEEIIGEFSDFDSLHKKISKDALKIVSCWRTEPPQISVQIKKKLNTVIKQAKNNIIQKAILQTECSEAELHIVQLEKRKRILDALSEDDPEYARLSQERENIIKDINSYLNKIETNKKQISHHDEEIEKVQEEYEKLLSKAQKPIIEYLNSFFPKRYRGLQAFQQYIRRAKREIELLSIDFSALNFLKNPDKILRNILKRLQPQTIHSEKIREIIIRNTRYSLKSDSFPKEKIEEWLNALQELLLIINPSLLENPLLAEIRWRDLNQYRDRYGEPKYPHAHLRDNTIDIYPENDHCMAVHEFIHHVIHKNSYPKPQDNPYNAWAVQRILESGDTAPVKYESHPKNYYCFKDKFFEIYMGRIYIDKEGAEEPTLNDITASDFPEIITMGISYLFNKKVLSFINDDFDCFCLIWSFLRNYRI